MACHVPPQRAPFHDLYPGRHIYGLQFWRSSVGNQNAVTRRLLLVWGLPMKAFRTLGCMAIVTIPLMPISLLLKVLHPEFQKVLLRR